MDIQIESVHKRIKGTTILNNVNLQMKGGMVYGLQGPNGSGKTMLMRLIAGLIRPSSGRVVVNGWKLGEDRDFPPSMGLLIENPAFVPHYTGLKNLELLAALRSDIDLKQIRSTICDVGLEPDDRRKFSKYSLGMKQRLGIAAAIMEQPDLIILDEPTNALDDTGVAQICKLICRERERGALIILTCHDADILERLADEVFVVNEGKVMKKVAR